MAAPDVQISWQDYLAVGLRRKRYLVIPLVASLCVGLWVAVFSPRIYAANAVLLVQSEKLINPLIQGLAMPMAIGDRLNTLREELLSWSNLSRLIKTHQLDKNIAPNDAVAFEKLVNKLRDDIAIRMKGGALIQVRYEGRDPAQVQQLVNTLADIVIERNTAIQEQEANTAVNFIEAELNVYRQKLEEAEQKLREFKELHMTQMPVATALNAKLRGLELTLSNLMIDNMEAHPRVQEVKRQIEETRRQRDEEVRRLVAKGIIADTDAELYQDLVAKLGTPEAANATDPNMQKANDAYHSLVQGLETPEIQPTQVPTIAMTQEQAQGGAIEVDDLAATTLTLAPRQQQELSRLRRDYSVNAQIYRGLLEKLERAKITGRLGDDEQGGKFVIIERARYPLEPFSPNVGQVFLVSLLVGLVLGAATVVAAEYLDQAVQNADEVMELLEVPVLGSIATIVTEGDLAERKHRRSPAGMRQHGDRLKAQVANPVWARVDRLLVRWGL